MTSHVSSGDLFEGRRLLTIFSSRMGAISKEHFQGGGNSMISSIGAFNWVT